MPKPQINSKNLEILSELMMLEELAYKKNAQYSKSFKDAQLQETCKTLAANHKARYTALYDYLNSHE